ncbi:hypothetical protein CC86DRAFT_402524 [Ophiobolus disseminans]|uniref:Uncharacterized protein n=1 Tax=Ophiobolus disseminans TaxID=1469910 RepID=A0A6A7AB78_9PLEO|nr:hypothetical protein CC86DRAFT_402524 [Ophiobolus disseminans]
MTVIPRAVSSSTTTPRPNPINGDLVLYGILGGSIALTLLFMSALALSVRRVYANPRVQDASREFSVAVDMRMTKILSSLPGYQTSRPTTAQSSGIIRESELRNAPEKPVVLDNKRMLGLDTATFLSRLPLIHAGTNSTDLVVTPAYVQPRHENINWNQGLQVDQSSGSNQNHPAIHDQLHRAEASDKDVNSGGVNPWHVERCPNPFIFKHLWEEPAVASPQRIAHNNSCRIGEIRSDDQGDLRAGEREAEEVVPVSVARPLVVPIPSDSNPSLDQQYESSVVDELEKDSITPATSTSSLSMMTKPKRALLGPFEVLDLFSFAAVIPEQLSLSSSPLGSPEVATNETAAVDADTHALRPEDVIPTPSASIESTPLFSVTSPSTAGGRRSNDTKLSCPDCDLHFPTPGLLRYANATTHED